MQRVRSYVPVGVFVPLLVLALVAVGAAVVSMSSGATSDALALQEANCEVGPESHTVPGEIAVKMMPGADIGAILEEEGEPPDAARTRH